jgi:hypothetical protein
MHDPGSGQREVIGRAANGRAATRRSGIRRWSRSLRARNWTATWVLGLAVATLALLSVLFLPRILIDSREAQLTAKERLDAEADIRSALIQMIGGTVLLTGLYFTARGFRLTREGHITDRYAKAIELLGSDKMEVRLGGVYALERLAKDSRERDSSTILEVLCAYVREHAPWPPRDRPGRAPGDDAEEPKPHPDTDVQAALTALGRRDRMDGEPPLDLRYTDLRGADLVRADLKGALLFGAHLEGAYLDRGTHLEEALMEKAWLDGAKLMGAYLRAADLRGVSFRGADLRDAQLHGADLRGALLDGTDLGAAAGLTAEQIGVIGQWDEATTLPPGLHLPERVKAGAGGGGAPADTRRRG